MSRVGLTPAMRSVLEDMLRDQCTFNGRLLDRAIARGFIGNGNDPLSSRGLAALAAPAMTRAEYEMLMRCANPAENWCIPLPRSWDRTLLRLYQRGLQSGGKATRAGRAALNNIRAAIGSDQWKEDA